MKRVFCFTLVLFIASFFVSCNSAPEYKPTKESSTNYDIIDEDQK